MRYRYEWHQRTQPKSHIVRSQRVESRFRACATSTHGSTGNHQYFPTSSSGELDFLAAAFIAVEIIVAVIIKNNNRRAVLSV